MMMMMMMMITKTTKISLFVLLAGMISGSSAGDFDLCSRAGNQRDCDIVNYYGFGTICEWDDQTNNCEAYSPSVNLVANEELRRRSTYIRRPSQPRRLLVDKNIDSSWHSSGSGDAASDEYEYDDEDEDKDEDGGEDIDTSSSDLDLDLDGEPKPNVVSDRRSYLRSN